MQIFVYEHISGGGLLGCRLPPEGSLLREGAGMLRALTVDLARIENCTVTTTWDGRLDAPPEAATVHRVFSAEEERTCFRRLATQAQAVFVIAPECNAVLWKRVREVEQLGGRLLSPNSEFVAIATDKHWTGQILANCGVPTPHAALLHSGEPLPREFPYPAVLKPRDGAGSQDVFWISGPNGCVPQCSSESKPDQDAFELSNAEGASAANGVDNDSHATAACWRLEQFCPGMPASISLLCGPAGSMALPACRQNLSDDGRFHYLGGSTPLPPPLHDRAARLAHGALDAFPRTTGYVGFDLILGEATDGSQDMLIEVNPRLTTSYLGVRKVVAENPAALMLQVANSKLNGLSRLKREGG